MLKVLDIDPASRQKTAEDFFLQGYNCSQSVLLAFSDILPLDKEVLLSLSSGFGGGMARMREICGTVSAMTFIAGFISPATDPSNMSERTANYALVQTFAEKFKQEKGSIICREILGLRKQQKLESPAPSERTPEYYKSRPCTATVGFAARIVAQYLKENIE